MIGIPFIVRRFSDHGAEDTTLYLRTRRGAMRDGLRAYHDAMLAQTVAASRVAAIMGKAMKAEQDGMALDLDALLADQEKALAESARQSDLAMRAAESVALMALADNYPDIDAHEKVSGLTDREIRAIVATVEMGAMPKDFFTSSDTPPSPNSITPSGPLPVSDSSKQDSPGETSKMG